MVVGVVSLYGLGSLGGGGTDEFIWGGGWSGEFVWTGRMGDGGSGEF